MSMTVDWDNTAQTVLCYRVSGRWTWEEFYAMRDHARHLADSVGQTQIDSIIDISTGSLFPKDVLLHMRKMPSDGHEKLKFGTVVVVGNNLFMRAMMDVMRRINPQVMKKFHSVQTLEQARTLLTKLQSVAAA